MDTQDKDYSDASSSNDKATHKEQKPAVDNSSAELWKTLIKNMLSWISLILIFLVIFSHYKPLQRPHAQLTNNALIPIAKTNNCGSLPPHGSAYMIDPSVMRRTDVLYSGLEIQNNYSYPMVIILSDPAKTRRFLAASISSSNTTQISIPVGQYGMQVLVGSDWCNLETGFSDGANISVSGGISINPGSTTLMQFSGSGLDPVQLALAYSIVRAGSEEIKQLSEVISSGKLELQQTRDGHYFSAGTVNGSPVVFMIDTGATIVSISSEIASQAGIQKCSPRLVSTANGKVSACAATVAEITFGSFKLTNVDVNVMPDMPGSALLGMNVLRNFHIEQINKVMRISSH
ncbi:clan AA aspartic protease (TIGR02281 family) [Nitrosomonas sp. Nm84]|uniref:retropepsin-like aspartic protease family protein n=1 Tax=Nitrosomonas sp. Nm84 TaxID=200124 RepID=UPI000D76A027|nr:retropepsin-like aspartic protease [Nitrosomonas sp. Nm84]PXW83483.1 clan AA aspartic protease (TIGR02281 family) [Nitrosomonas sp. Nm84]